MSLNVQKTSELLTCHFPVGFISWLERQLPYVMYGSIYSVISEESLGVCDLVCFGCVAVQPLPKGDQVLNFSDAEQMVDDVKLK